ncbi:MAG: hypothetical protein U0Y82_14815 [Thermoleophilia bacterium]
MTERRDAELDDYARDVAGVERLTRAVMEWMVASLMVAPIWLALLVVVPNTTGLGVGLSALISCTVGWVLAFAVWRWVIPHRKPDGTAQDRAPLLTPGLRWTMLVCAGVIVLYVVLISMAGN